MLEIIGLICIAVGFVKAEPAILVKRALGFKEENYYEYGKVKKFIYRAITCIACSGFWIALFYTLNLFTAAIVMVGGMILEKYLDNDGYGLE